MPTHTTPLVGMHFRPPAKAILACLPAGQKLNIVPEPDNAYDANALAVFVTTGDIPESAYEELGREVVPFGFELADIFKEPCWHLGYVKATEAVNLVGPVNSVIAANDWPSHPAKLSFDAKGKPTVQLELS